MPGHPLDPRAGGCNQLIREGARLVRGVEDVIEALAEFLPAPPRPAPVRAGAAPVARPAPPVPADPTRLHRRILDALGPSPLAEDQLLRDLALPVEQVAPAILFLELAGQVRRQPGGLLALA